MEIERKLGNEQISKLNEARRVLDALYQFAYYDGSTQNDGIVAHAAQAAADAIFEAMNVVNSFWHVEMTHAQLHEDGRHSKVAG